MTALVSDTALPLDLTPSVLQGHVLEVLRSLPEGSVHCVVTSPPYWGLRAYGTDPQVWGGEISHSHEWGATPPRRPRSAEDVRNPESLQAAHEGTRYEAQGDDACSCGAWRGELGLEPTPELFVSHLADVFDEVRRVLRKDGTCWVNLGDTYATHPAGLTGEARWAKSGLGNVAHDGHEQAGSFDKRAPGLKPKDLVGIPWRVAFELQRRGWWLRSDCVWAKPNPMPESVRDRPTRSHEYVFLLSKSERYFYDADAVRGPIAESTANRARNHYPNPTDNPDPDSKWGKNEWRSYPVFGRREGKNERSGNRLRDGINDRTHGPGGPLYANLKSVWWIPTQPYPEAHFATYPEEVVERAILAGTSERGACHTCGAPFIREVRAEGGTIGSDASDWHPKKALRDPEWEKGWKSLRVGRPQGSVGLNGKDLNESYRRVDLGFKPGCDHGAEPAPCLVLDPFCGSGTSLSVARSLGRRAVGIELNPEYVALARRRCRASVPDIQSFGEVVTA